MSELDRVRAIVADVRFPGYAFEVCPLGPSLMDSAVGIRVVYREPDVMSGVEETQQGRWWVINREWGPGQVVQTVLKALLTSLEHRAREGFLWRGRPVLQPHFPLEQLWELAAPREHEGEAIPFAER